MACFIVTRILMIYNRAHQHHLSPLYIPFKVKSYYLLLFTCPTQVIYTQTNFVIAHCSF